MIIPFKDKYPKIPASVFVAPGAMIIGDVEIGEKSSVWFNTVIRGDVHYIRIGSGTNLQDLSVLHVTRRDYPLRVGDHVTVGHRVILHGCTIGNFCLIGMGSVIMDGAVVEEGSFIGAGSLVSEGTVIPSGMLAFGHPAKPKRPLNDAEKAFLRQAPEGYIDDADHYLRRQG